MNGRSGRSLRTTWWAATAAVAALAGGVSPAQTIESLPLARSYGSGVHAYFSGNFDRTYDDLTAVIEAGSEDPRALYFRGLAALRLGRSDEAEADFSAGAMLEARAAGNWRVSQSLERVQGCDRLQLERHRVRARVAALQRDRQAERERYLGSAAAQPDVLRRRRPDVLPAPPADASNPFEDRTEDAGRAVEPPVAPDLDAGEPAGEPAAEVEPPAVEQPPASEQLEPAMEVPPAQPGDAAEMPAAVEGDAPGTDAGEPAEPIEPAAPADEPVSPPAPAPAVEDPFADIPSPAAEPPAEPMGEGADGAAGGQ